MIKRYKRFPMPIEAWQNFKARQAEINNDLQRWTGKKKSVPMTKVVLEASKVPNIDIDKFVRGSRK